MRKLILTLTIPFILVSCNKEAKNDPYKDLKTSSNNSEVSNDDLKYKIILPDTVKVNKKYTARVNFESEFDSIASPIIVDEALNDTTKTRLVTFYHFEPTEFPANSERPLILIDSTFVTNKSFVVENVLFKEKGKYIFQGLIFDELMYNFYNDKGVRDSVHFERRKQQIFKKVVVVE